MAWAEHSVSTEEKINGCKISVGKHTLWVKLENCTDNIILYHEKQGVKF